jgi:hypothetical protein
MGSSKETGGKTPRILAQLGDADRLTCKFKVAEIINDRGCPSDQRKLFQYHFVINFKYTVLGLNTEVWS